KGGSENAGARRSNSVRVCQCIFISPSAGILVHGQQGRYATAFAVYTSQQVTGTLGCNHHNVHVTGRNEGFEMNAEPVRNAQDFSRVQVGPDSTFIYLCLGFIRGEDLDPVGALDGFRWRDHGEPISPRLYRRRTLWVQDDNYTVAAVTEILRLGMTLVSIAQDSDRFSLLSSGVGIVFI